MTSKASAPGCVIPLGTLGCSCIFSAAMYAAIAVAVVLAVHWALATHIFGL